MRHYEILFLIHPDQNEQIPGMIERYKNIATTNGGKVTREEDWGKRPLAYSINDISKAHYILLNIECSQAQIAELKAAFRFNDAIIRYVLISTKHATTTPSPLMSASEKKEDNKDNNRSRHDKRSNTMILNDLKVIDYKNIDHLKRFITETGKIIPARVTGASAKYQRRITQAIKRARNVALLPFSHSHKR